MQNCGQRTWAWSAEAVESSGDYVVGFAANLALAHAGHLPGWLGGLGLVSHNDGPV
jgi:hypothetical protein